MLKSSPEMQNAVLKKPAEFFRSQCQLIWFGEKKSAKSASGHKEYSFGHPCLKSLAGTRKKPNRRLRELFCSKSSSRKQNAVFTKPAEFFRSQCQLIWFCETNSAKSVSGHVEYSFGNPCLKNLAKTRKKSNRRLRELFCSKIPRKSRMQFWQNQLNFFLHSAN